MRKDAARARERLAQLAALGRALAQADATEQRMVRTRLEAQLQDERQRAARIATFSAWRSITIWLDPAVAFGVAASLIAPLSTALPVLPWVLTALPASALCLAAAWFARRRARAFITRHPFPIHGYGEALHHPGHGNDPDGGAGTQEAKITVLFVERITEGKTLRDALHAAAGSHFQSAYYGGRRLKLKLRGPSQSSLHGHRRWLHRSMRRLSPVLCAAHATAAIESVRVDAEY